MADMTEQNVNTIETPYGSLFRAVSAGSDAEILDALAGLVEACPEVGDWLAKEIGKPVGTVMTALTSTRDAFDFAAFDDGGDEDHVAASGSLSSVEVSTDELDLDALLDDAAAFGTLADTLDWLAESDPMAYEVIAREHGLGCYEEHQVKEVAEAIGRSREMTRRYRTRGYTVIRRRMEALGRLSK